MTMVIGRRGGDEKARIPTVACKLTLKPTLYQYKDFQAYLVSKPYLGAFPIGRAGLEIQDTVQGPDYRKTTLLPSCPSYHKCAPSTQGVHNISRSLDQRPAQKKIRTLQGDRC